MRAVYIHSAACLAHDPAHDFTALKRGLEERSGKKFRRVNRFIVLALASVYQLPTLGKIDPEASLYLGTKHGCATDSFGMLTQMYRDELIPLPFTFINTSSNMAGFYVAQSLGLSGENYTFAQPWGSFEKAFSLAYRDIQTGRNAAALAGSCDEAVFPLEESRKAMQMPDDEQWREGGCWMHLSSDESGALATMKQLCSVSSLQEIDDAFAMFGACAGGAFLIDATIEYTPVQAIEIIPLAAEKEKLIGSSGGMRMVQLLEDPSYGTLFYLCREGLKRYTLWAIEKLKH